MDGANEGVVERAANLSAISTAVDVAKGLQRNDALGHRPMAATYAQHASGELFNTASGQELRKVVTTRKDGNIFWDV